MPRQSLKNNVIPCEAWNNNKPDLSHLRVFGSILYAKKPVIRRGKLDTLLVTRCILLGYTSTSRNAIYHYAITKETKTSRHFVVDEAHYASKTQRPSYSKDLINNNRDKLTRHPKSFDSAENHLANAITAIHQHYQVTPSELHLTNSHGSPSCHITIPIKGQHPTLGLEISTND